MTGQEYWRKRFEALHESLLADGEGSYKDAERIFAEARRRIEADLARWYMRLAKNNQVSLTEARKLLSKDELKEFHWTVEEYMKLGRENAVSGAWMKELENASAKFHISRLESIRIQMQQHLEELYGNYNDALDDTMRRLYSDGYYKTAYTLEQGFHTGFDVSKLNDKDIDTLLKKPWAADGKNFSTRIWGDKDKLMNTLQTELVQGLIRGDPLQKITKRFADKMGASQSNAKRLIYTESAYFAAAGEYQGMKELGVEKYEYLATLDSRTSEICQDMDGKIFKMSEYMPGTTAPPLHVHCRSTTVPYYGKGGTLRAARDAKNKTVYVPDMPYKDWKAIYVDKTQTLEKWQAKQHNTSQKADNVRKTKNKNDIIIEKGALNDKNDPWGVRRDAHAERYYEFIRQSDRENWISRISQNSGMRKASVAKIYEHVFIEKHHLMMGYSRFPADYSMAESFQRLFDGQTIYQHDLIMLKHERLEAGLMNRYGYSFAKAHEITERKYNYSAALMAWEKEHHANR